MPAWAGSPAGEPAKGANGFGQSLARAGQSWPPLRLSCCTCLLSTRRRPLFVVKMLVEGDAFKFAPSQGGLTKAVQGVVDQFVAMMNTIPRIEG